MRSSSLHACARHALAREDDQLGQLRRQHLSKYRRGFRGCTPDASGVAVQALTAGHAQRRRDTRDEVRATAAAAAAASAVKAATDAGAAQTATDAAASSPNYDLRLCARAHPACSAGCLTLSIRQRISLYRISLAAAQPWPAQSVGHVTKHAVDVATSRVLKPSGLSGLSGLPCRAGHCRAERSAPL